ncbi:MAG: hypothetical protein NT166_28630 [Candidatus Aminicenantes bacterium]|nr:hypothetical protein [Candidatus Aminicenantes bacterium]
MGELLWNFMEAQVVNLRERLGEDQAKVYYYKFLLKFFLPALGFEMEKAGLFDFTNAQINLHIDHICKRFSQADFFDTYAEFEEQARNLPVGACAADLERRERIATLKSIFCEELHMLVKEGEGKSFRFLHQDFRDFFAAVHLLNEIEMGKANGKRIPEGMKERCLGCYVRRMMGEIDGEHYAKPYVVKGEGWRSDINRGNRLHGLVDCCRGKFDEDVGYAVWNVVSTWQEVRGELSGADLSRLDLSRVPLNGVMCCRLYGEVGGRYLAAKFDGARVPETNLFPQGHLNRVNSAVYSPIGDKIVSASLDGTVKEWDATTDECIRTLAGRIFSVYSVVYSRDGEKILSSSDNTIKEWDVATGECVQILAGHTNVVNSAVYSPIGDKILSASADQTVKEWDAATGKCLHTLEGHTNVVSSAVYSPAGDKILSASWDYTFKEWDAATGKCLRTLAGHTFFVSSAVYSLGGDKILSASYDQTVKEWDVATGECLRTLEGHTEVVNSAVYSPAGDKILSASYDQTVKEWDAATGECIRTLAGQTGTVNSAVHSPGGDKIVSASYDQTVKEWDAATGKCLRTLGGHTSWVKSAVYSPGGDKILSASADQTVKEWDAATGDCIRTLAGHNGAIISALYSPAGDKILSASYDHTVKEWDAVTGDCIRTLAGHNGAIISAVYSPAGDKILSASWDCTFKEWDTATGECLKTHRMEDYPDLPEYYSEKTLNKKLNFSGSIIYFLLSTRNQEYRILLNIPGLSSQGCSFKHLEKKAAGLKKCRNNL